MGEEGRTSKASRIGLEILGWLLLAAGVAALVLPGCQWPVCGPRFWPGESPHPCGSSSGFQGRPPGVVVSCEVEGRLRCRGRCSSTDRLRAGCPGEECRDTKLARVSTLWICKRNDIKASCFRWLQRRWPAALTVAALEVDQTVSANAGDNAMVEELRRYS